jgi:hypothetical protein
VQAAAINIIIIARILPSIINYGVRRQDCEDRRDAHNHGKGGYQEGDEFNHGVRGPICDQSTIRVAAICETPVAVRCAKIHCTPKTSNIKNMIPASVPTAHNTIIKAM